MSESPSPPNPGVSRRAVMRGLTVGGLSLPLLAACGGGSSSGGGGGSGGSQLTRTASVPVGGGVVLADQQVVVTQPAANEFKAFSAVCTHMGCLVNKVADGTIDCPCHGSRFSVKDGSVVAGPAPTPLPSVSITVSKGTINRA